MYSMLFWFWSAYSNDSQSNWYQIGNALSRWITILSSNRLKLFMFELKWTGFQHVPTTRKPCYRRLIPTLWVDWSCRRPPISRLYLFVLIINKIHYRLLNLIDGSSTFSIYDFEKNIYKLDLRNYLFLWKKTSFFQKLWEITVIRIYDDEIHLVYCSPKHTFITSRNW
jgi:hypothetical protein